MSRSTPVMFASSWGLPRRSGLGVNVQARAAAHCIIWTCPGVRRDIEQREGRIIRQGNEVYGPVMDDETGELTGPWTYGVKNIPIRPRGQLSMSSCGRRWRSRAKRSRR